jgi:DNA-binding transcriptional LysR family regulator
MELMQLEMFVAVVEERNFARAAERVFRTQPAVSIGIRKLEGKIGRALFDRSHRRSGRLTAAGDVLYDYASRILALRDAAICALQKKESVSTGNLRIGVTTEGHFDWIPQATRKFSSQYPEIRLEGSYDHPVHFFRELTEQRLDIALLSGRPRGDARSKNFVISRVRGGNPSVAFWMVRRRLEHCVLAHAFEECVVGHLAPAARTAQSLTRIPLRRRSPASPPVAKRVLGSGNTSR